MAKEVVTSPKIRRSSVDLFNPADKLSSADLESFVVLLPADQNPLPENQAVNKISNLVGKLQIKDLDSLRSFFIACNSVSAGIKFLEKLSSNPCFNYQENIGIITEICGTKKKAPSMLATLGSILEQFKSTSHTEVLSVIQDLTGVDKDTFTLFVGFNTVCNNPAAMTEKQKLHLLDLGLKNENQAGLFFIQFLAALEQKPANELLTVCANSNKTPQLALREHLYPVQKKQPEPRKPRVALVLNVASAA